MKTIDNKELKEIIQSGHINLLIGSGCSLDYLTNTQRHWNRMNEESTKEKAQKDYYKLIKKSKAVLDDRLKLILPRKPNWPRQSKITILF